MTDDIVNRAIAGNWHSAKIVVPPDTPHTFQGKEFYEPMTDDIVTRLRDLCCDHILDGYDTEQQWLQEAITEITSLRNQVETWKRLGSIEPFMTAYRKARWGND